VTIGAVLTVNIAAVVVAVPHELVKTARYLLPFCEAAAVKVNVVLVAPETLEKVLPPLVLTCHWTVGAGLPLAAAVKLTLLPLQTVWFVGFVVMAGAVQVA